MANFDTNSWYQIVTSQGTTHSMQGTQLYDQGKGAVFMKTTNVTNEPQQWQIFPFNSTYYVLRSKASGAQGYMGARSYTEEDTPGNTVPNMQNSTLSDESMFWSIDPWGDGTFYFTNAANGTAWHLNVKPNTLMAMTSNISTQQDSQSFSFTKLGSIDTARFSSVILPSALQTSTRTSTTSPATTTTSTTTSTSTSSSKSGLSTGAKAGIGAGVGAVVLIVLLVLGFFLYKRKQRSQPSPPAPPYHPIYEYKGPHEMGHKGAYDIKRPTELETVMPAMELHSQHQDPAELAGTRIG